MMKQSDFWTQTQQHQDCDLPSPCYIFDVDVLHQTVSSIRQALPACHALCFAMKANPFLIRYADPWVDRVEVCSPGEFEICRQCQISPEKIILSGVHKTRQFLQRVMELQGGAGLYTVESMQQYEMISSLAREMGLQLRLLVRLTSGNQFGVDEQALHVIFERNRIDPCCRITGIHYFSGTQKHLKKIKQELEALGALAERLRSDYDLPDLELEYGPGLAVDYFGDSRILPAEEQLAELNRLLQTLTGFDSVGIELGRFMTADCGCFLTTVHDVKTNGGTNYVILDSGIHQVHYFGQMMGMNVPPICQAGPVKKDDRLNYTLCGALCTSNDVLVRQISLHRLKPGDRLMFQKCGAYSVTEGSALFLSRELPPVYIYSDRWGYTCLRQRFETCRLNTLI